MMTEQTYTSPLIGASFTQVPGFRCFTTSTAFDRELKTDWKKAGHWLMELIEEETGTAPRAIIFANQVHGNVVKVGSASGGALQRMMECDGLATADAGVYLVIRTADCLPVMLVDSDAGTCAALHAGWRGTLGNITTVGIQTLIALGAKADRIRGWIGPRIGGDRYEVSPDLIADFRNKFNSNQSYINGRLLNLPLLNQLQALDAGAPMESITDSDCCTLSQEHLFYSHRRQGSVRGQQFNVCGFQ